MYYPLLITFLSGFEDWVGFDPFMRLYITYNVFDQYSPKNGKNIDEWVALFNVCFDDSATRENFLYAEAHADINADILAESLMMCCCP